nr:hypothetical protein [Photorhabdus luminescens]
MFGVATFDGIVIDIHCPAGTATRHASMPDSSKSAPHWPRHGLRPRPGQRQSAPVSRRDTARPR